MTAQRSDGSFLIAYLGSHIAADRGISELTAMAEHLEASEPVNPAVDALYADAGSRLRALILTLRTDGTYPENGRP